MELLAAANPFWIWSKLSNQDLAKMDSDNIHEKFVNLEEKCSLLPFFKYLSKAHQLDTFSGLYNYPFLIAIFSFMSACQASKNNITDKQTLVWRKVTILVEYKRDKNWLHCCVMKNIDADERYTWGRIIPKKYIRSQYYSTRYHRNSDMLAKIPSWCCWLHLH